MASKEQRQQRSAQPQLATTVFQYRLQTQSFSNKGDPPLLKLCKRVHDLIQEINSGGGDAPIAVKHKALQRELTGLTYQVTKFQLARAAAEQDRRDHKRRRDEIEASKGAADEAIEMKKSQLEEAKQERRRQEEYEVLREQVCRHPKRAATLKRKHGLEAECKDLEKSIAAVDEKLEIRRKEAYLLCHSLANLQQQLAADTAAANQ